MNFEFLEKTVVVLAGPSCSGKSTLVEAIRSKLQEEGVRTAVVSSDAERHAILGSAFSRHSPEMNAASDQAFQLVESKLKILLDGPILPSVVFIDSTGGNPEFRMKMAGIAKQAGYFSELLIFDYADKKDYFPEDFEELGVFTKDVIRFSVDRHLKMTLPNQMAAAFDKRVLVKNKVDLAALSAKVTPSAKVLRLDRAWVIGDVHECVGELSQLVEKIREGEKARISGSPGKILLLGDFVDKGGKTLETLEYIKKLMDEGQLEVLMGNQESYAYRRITDPRFHPEERLEEGENAPFSSIKVLLSDERAKAIFLEIMDKAYHFAEIMNGSIVGSYVTHAPARKAFLGKQVKEALTVVRNYRINDRTVPLETELGWLYQEAEANYNDPLHIFGHCSHFSSTDFDCRTLSVLDTLKFGNKVFLDTGCVQGGHLTAVEFIGKTIGQIFQVPSSRPKNKEENIAVNLGLNPKAKLFDANSYALNPHEDRLISQIEKEGIQYISGTLSPGPSKWDYGDRDVDGRSNRVRSAEIEPFKSAVALFSRNQEKGDLRLIAEEKWMGSRAQAYIFKGAPEKTFLVSRAGWKIGRIHKQNGESMSEEELADFCKEIGEKYQGLAATYGNMILDGELMPWHALGKGLIEKDYKPYYIAMSENLEATLSAAIASNNVTLKEYAERKLGHLQKFQEVLGFHATVTEPEYKPFSILKTEIPNTLNEKEKYQILNPDAVDGQVKYVSFDPTVPEEVEAAEQFFQQLTGSGLEGVVLKVEGETDNTTFELPPVKVRSTEYLRLVYGYDYEDRKFFLAKDKNIRSKLRVSQEERKRGKAMLNAINSQARTEQAVKLTAKMREEKHLDPRL